MASPAKGAIVLLHGVPPPAVDSETRVPLAQPIDPYFVFCSIVEYAEAFGWKPVPFYSTEFTLSKILRAFSKSEFDPLVEELNMWLNRQYKEILVECQRWIVCPHSAGGTVFYKWLTSEAGTVFPQLPNVVFAFDSPHQIVRPPLL